MSPLFKNDLIWSFFFPMNTVNGKVVVCDLLKKLTENWLLHVNVNIIIMHIGSDMLFITCKKHHTNSCLCKWANEKSVLPTFTFSRTSTIVIRLMSIYFFVEIFLCIWELFTLHKWLWASSSVFFNSLMVVSTLKIDTNFDIFCAMPVAASDVALLLLLRKNCDP